MRDKDTEIWEILRSDYPELYGDEAYKNMMLKQYAHARPDVVKGEDEIWAELIKWNPPRFPFRCDTGWNNMVRFASSIIRFHSRGTIPIVFQVKQKLGGLRIYAHNDIKEYDANIQRALHSIEELSFFTCEVCGLVGELRDIDGYLQTLCNDHFEKADKCRTHRHKG